MEVVRDTTFRYWAIRHRSKSPARSGIGGILNPPIAAKRSDSGRFLENPLLFGRAHGNSLISPIAPICYHRAERYDVAR